jgi:dTDP-glucose pyrophosphorylase
MKVVIAAAGRGTRMKHLTNNKPKHIIKILGRPFLYYLLENFKKAGYKEFCAVVGYQAEAICSFLEKYDPAIKIINQFKVLGEEEYGTACAIKCVRDFVKNKNFIAMYGDNLYSPYDMKSFNVNNKYCYAGGLLHPHPEKYGILLTHGEFLEKIIEKPKNPATNLINCGFYKFTFDIFRAIKKIRLSKRGEYELTDAVSILADQKKVKVKMIKDYWLDFGRLADISRLTKFLKTKKILKSKL